MLFFFEGKQFGVQLSHYLWVCLLLLLVSRISSLQWFILGI